MSEFQDFDFSKVVLSSYDPEKVTEQEKLEYGARAETTFTGNLFRGLEAGYDTLTTPDLTFKEAVANIESKRQADLFKEMPQFYGIQPEQEDATIVGGRFATAFADPITWLVPWTKIAAGGKAISALAGAGFAVADSATRDYLQTGEVSGFNTGVSAVVGAGAGTFSAALARRFKFNDDDVKPTGLESRLEPEQPLSVEEIGEIEKAAAKAVDPAVVEKHTREKPLMAINTQPIQELNKAINRLTKKRKKASKEGKEKIDSRIIELETKRSAERENYFRNQLDLSLDKQDINIAMLEDLSSQGKLTDGILSKIVYETTRPVVGGIGGFALSGVVGDEDSDGLTMGLMGAGVTMGVLHNRFRKAALSSVEKDTGLLRLNEAAGRNLQLSWKYLSSGTLSSRLDAMGGYAKIVGNMLFQRQNAPTDAVEARAIRETRKFNTTVNTILDDSFEDITVRKLAGQMINKFRVEDIKVGYTGINGTLKPVTAEQIAEARRVVPLLESHQGSLASSIREVGIDFKTLDQYGMAQVYDLDFIRKNQGDFELAAREAMKLQHPKLSGSALDMKVREFKDLMLGVERYSDMTRYTPENVFNKEGQFMPLLDHFDKHRMITNFDARQLLAERGFMQLDVSEVMSRYSDRAIKAREFASSFGAKGEFLGEVFEKLNDSFRGAGKNEAFGNQYKKEILNAVDAYWGTYGAGQTNKIGGSIMATLTTAANTTFLTRVSIASLGDMIQPFQNSGFGAATKALMKKAGPSPSFSKQVNFQYDNSFEREFTALMSQGGDPLDSYQYGLNWINKKFFKVVQLERITNAARGFAYDTGVVRAFTLASKRNLSKSNKKEASTMGLTSEDIDVLKQFKTAQQAFNDDIGRDVLDRIGQKVADRDAILPMVGNRLLFTQSKNPYIRSFGQFLSWAQAKTSQINSLIERVENGDGALAMRALGLTSIYGGVQYLRELSSPYYDSEEDARYLDTADTVDLAKKSLLLSGNYAPWQVDKLVNTANSLVTKGKLLDEATPSLSYALDFARALSSITGNVMAGDTEGIVVDVADVTPFGKEVLSYGERLNIIPELEDRANKAKGGVIANVPNVPTEPDERIDKMTGMPYDQQAGTAFVDEEDPLRRLGFGLGSLVARQAGRIMRNVDEAPVKTDKQLEADFDDLTQALDKGETPKMFEEPLNNITEPKKSEDYLTALNISKDEVDVWKTQNKADTTALDNIPEKQMLARELADQSRPIEQRRSNFLNYLEGKDSKGNVVREPVIKEWEVDSVEDLIKNMPSDRDVAMSVASKPDKNKFIIGVNDNLKTGDLLAFRLDIPAYRRHNIWTLTAHKPVKGLTWDSNKKGASEVLGYGKTGRLTNVVFSGGDPETNFKIASGAGAKTPLATMQGNWVNHDSFELAEEALRLVKDPKSGWVQIGYNPTNFANFYNRKTLEPITEAEDVIQIGGFLIAKNPKTVDFSPVFTTTKPMKFKDGKTIEAGTQIPFATGGRVLKALSRGRYATGKEVRADMRRSDGSVKSARGFLGPVENTVQGGIMTEVSIGTEINGKKMEIPAMVPTLTEDEVKALSSMKLEGNAKNIPESILIKAKEHALMRLQQGKSPFYQDGE